MNIQQTLHGYKDGHTLLASSLDLNSDVRRTMLPISDMSGGTMVKGFEDYITGYPLRQINAYALAKTWSAPEMKRPGCVWTHTLIIQLQDLMEILDLPSLTRLFERPSVEEPNLSNYSSTLSYFPEISGFEDMTIYNDLLIHYDILNRIVSKLYDQDEKSVIVRQPSSKSLEVPILRIWNQQWPRLKRNFTFCTGAITPRYIYGKPLELQVIPYTLDVNKLDGKIFSFVDEKQGTVNERTGWVDVLVKDQYKPSIKLRNFFNYFGSDLQMSRRSCKPLMESFLYFSENQPKLDKVFQFLAFEFPEKEDGSLLKSAIFNFAPHNFTSFLPSYDEIAVLIALSVTQYYESFDYEKLGYLRRFNDVFNHLNNKKVSFLKEIIKAHPNPNGEEAITNLAKTINGSQFAESFYADKQLFSIFIAISPSLTYNHKFWQVNEKNESEIIELLQKKNVSERVDWQTIIRILIKIHSSVNPIIFEECNADIEDLILNYINSEPEIDIGRNWLNYIRQRPDAVLSWLNEQDTVTTHAIEILVGLLDPNSKIVIENGANPWIGFIEKFKKADLNTLPIEINAFCLALGFNLTTTVSQVIFELTFEIVYFAIAAESLPYDSWRYLEKHTKPLSFWKDWDKCKKLTIALVEYYIENHWPIKSIANSVYSETLYDRIIYQYKKRK